ncbi:hypothetical protein H1C71_012465, partial [Ictidomys tridecemlineatus]
EIHQPGWTDKRERTSPRSQAQPQTVLTAGILLCVKIPSGWDVAQWQSVCLAFAKPWVRPPVPKKTKKRTPPKKNKIKKKKTLFHPQLRNHVFSQRVEETLCGT